MTIPNQKSCRIDCEHLVLFAVLFLLAFLGSLIIGPSAVGLEELLGILSGNEYSPAHLILVEIRMPRALLGLMIGATLGLAGAALQGYLRNPLAEPGLIGVSASFGAVVTIYTGWSGLFSLALPLGGIMGEMAMFCA